MDKRNKELLLAKIDTLKSSVGDTVIQTLCDLLTDIVCAQSGEEIGFKSK